MIGESARLLPPLISDAFDSITKLFAALSGRCLRATSLMSAVPFSPIPHPSVDLRLLIRRSTFSADSFFDIRYLITANSLFSVRLPNP
jgi:hypothetical protein